MSPSANARDPRLLLMVAAQTKYDWSQFSNSDNPWTYMSFARLQSAWARKMLPMLLYTVAMEGWSSPSCPAASVLQRSAENAHAIDD